MRTLAQQTCQISQTGRSPGLCRGVPAAASLLPLPQLPAEQGIVELDLLSGLQQPDH